MPSHNRQRHYYFEQIGVTPYCLDVEKLGRGPRWKKQRQKYGFDDRQTWSLDFTMICLLYERLRMYKDTATMINLEWHQITVGKETKTQGQWIDELIKDCETYFKESDDLTNGAGLYTAQRIWDVWKELQDVMWW